MDISRQKPATLGKNLSQKSRLPISVDLIRTVSIVGVILLHASNDLTSQPMGLTMNSGAMTLEIFRWSAVTIYQSVGRVGVPLFVMLSGVLLLQPGKTEDLGTFFKKRWARIGLPFIFWGVIYFLWDFLVERQAFSANAIVQGILTGPYYQFWYIYMLAGLYLLTPFLRVMVAHIDRSLFRLGLAMWFVGSAMLPVLQLISPFHLEADVLTIPGYVGYYILGVYLLNVKVSRRTLIGLMTAGFALTAFGTYVMAWNIGGPQTYFFQQYLSPTMILAAVPLFLLLSTMKMPWDKQPENTMLPVQENAEKKKEKQSWTRRIVTVISANTLAIFLFHEMVLLTFQKGYLGITINGNTINSIVGVPLMTVIALAISLAVIVPLKKVPILKNFIG